MMSLSSFRISLTLTIEAEEEDCLNFKILEIYTSQINIWLSLSQCPSLCLSIERKGGISQNLFGTLVMLMVFLLFH